MVTGANTGLGRGIAVALAQAGADIVAVGRTAPLETKEAVTNEGRRFLAVEADLQASDRAREVVQRALAEFERVDILINNAGTIRRNDALTFSDEEWNVVTNTNLKTPFFLAQAAAASMIERGQGGRIINIASMLSFQGGIRTASYTASKSGLAGLTKLLANEWARYGINVNAIAPGYFETNNTTAIRADSRRSSEILGRIPAGRWGDPSDIGGAAVFLSSAAAEYIHGVVLPVDGGWLAY